MARVHRTLPALTGQQKAVFMSKIRVAGPGECWEWTGRTTDGYGAFNVGVRDFRANRLAYFFEHPDFDQTLNVLHSCDNPCCCNPKHLFAGTQADNVRDMISKGRANPPKGDRHHFHTHKHRVCRRTGDEHWSHQHPEFIVKGERSGMSKLTDDDVRELRRLYFDENYNFCWLGRKFNVSRTTVRNAVVRRTWKHVP